MTVRRSSSIEPRITTIAAQAGASYAIDPADGAVQKIQLDADSVTLSLTGLDAESVKSVTVILDPGAGAPRLLDFEASWLWVGTKPADLANTAIGSLVLMSTGSAATDVIASYQVLGDGT